jgi:acyl-CoA thioesterase II
VTNARQFLGMEPVGDLDWRLTVTPELTTPGKFLFGGCGLGAALVALEAASGRPTVWSTAHYLSYAPVDSVLDLNVTLAAEGRRVTQARVVGRVGEREILTVNAAAGEPGALEDDGVWLEVPDVPPPDECPPRRLPDFSSTSIFDRIDVRLARGRSVEEVRFGSFPGGDPETVLWARVPGHLEPSAATLAIIGDYVSGGVSQPLGRPVMTRSLDNTLRVVQLEPTEWVLCHIRIQAVAAGYGHGTATLWSQGGTLLAAASQSMSVRPWEAARLRQLSEQMAATEGGTR